MKRILIFLMAMSFSLVVAAQATDNNNNNAAAERKAQLDATHQKQEEAREAQRKKLMEDRAEHKAKLDSARQAQKERMEQAQKERQEKMEEEKRKRAAAHRKTDENYVAPDPEVVQLYYQLPLADLPQLSEYLKIMKPRNNNDDMKDGKDLRKGFIVRTDGSRQFIVLQRPGETKYTHIQEYKTKDYKRILAVETTSCAGSCSNELKFFLNDGGEWKDVTEHYIYRPDKKSTLKRIKQQYQDEYMDTHLYDSRDYQDSANYAKAINYNISPDENKIIIRDQYLPLNLYEMTWNSDKGKFDVKKL